MNDNMRLKEFEDNFKLIEQLVNLRSFHEQISFIMKRKKWNSGHFEQKTELGRMMYTRAMKDKNHRFTLKSIVSMCVGLELNLVITQILLKSQRLELEPENRVHYAYAYLIQNYPGLDIFDFNEKLAGMGIDEKHFLGSISYDK